MVLNLMRSMTRLAAILLIAVGILFWAYSGPEEVSPPVAYSASIQCQNADLSETNPRRVQRSTPLSCNGTMAEQARANGEDGNVMERVRVYLRRTVDDPLALFTFTLFFSTLLLWMATRDAISDGKQASQRELRAYVGVQSMRFEVRSDESTHDPALQRKPGELHPDYIVLDLKNFGRTPAFKVATRVSFLGLPPGGGIHPASDLDTLVHNLPVPAGETQIRALLQGGQSTEQAAPVYDMRQYWTAAKRQSQLFVLGRIYYVDTFGKHWSTKFCYVWEPNGTLGQRFVPWSIYNDEDQQQNPDTVPTNKNVQRRDGS